MICVWIYPQRYMWIDTRGQSHQLPSPRQACTRVEANYLRSIADLRVGREGVHSKTVPDKRLWEKMVTEIPAGGISGFLFGASKPLLRWTPRCPLQNRA